MAVEVSGFVVGSGGLMGFGTAKWSRQISEVRLPRPRILKIQVLNAGPAEEAMLDSFRRASEALQNESLHRIVRWETLGEHAKHIGEYGEVLGTYASLKDPIFLEPITSIDEKVRESHINALLANSETYTHGLAAALCMATQISALATALTAFAVNNPSRQSFSDASNSTRAADRFFADYEALESRTL